MCSSENSIKYLYNNIISNKSIVKCKNCEIEYLYPYPTQKELSDIYSDDYAAWGIGQEDNFSKMKRDKFRKLLKDILKYKNNGKLLDIGCGPGYLMIEAKNLGFDVYGIEVGEKAANIAKEKFGDDKIYNGILEKSDFNHNYFDIIMMSDVLEHVENPLELFKISYDLLKQDGYVVITTPNTNSFTCRIMKSKWSHYNIEHIHYFNKKSIEKLSSITGFEIIEIKPFWKVLTFKYMNSIFKYNNRKLLSGIFSVLEKIPIIGNLEIPILIGEFFIVLNKKNK
ncbi:hypothetical protein KQ44_03815 [Brachyspira sp. G79]|nr:hypothetical protein KQ44_03815 [Brachyspira sp. G79]